MWKCSEMVMEQPSAPLHWANVSVFSKSLKVWAFLFFPATGTSHGHICLPLPWHWRQKLLGWWFQTPLESSSHLLESVSFSFRFLRVSPSPCSSFIPFFCLSLFFFYSMCLRNCPSVCFLAILLSSLSFLCPCLPAVSACPLLYFVVFCPFFNHLFFLCLRPSCLFWCLFVSLLL